MTRNKLPTKNRNRKKIVVAVSGGFDPIHIGHVRMFNEAKALGDELVVILNNDNWIRAKKKIVFMTQKERKELIESIRSVDRVVLTTHKPNTKDMSVAKDLLRLKPNIFANGGDRKKGNLRSAELDVCEKINCKHVTGIGRGGKIQSSSILLTNYLNNIKK